MPGECRPDRSPTTCCLAGLFRHGVSGAVDCCDAALHNRVTIGVGHPIYIQLLGSTKG